MVQTKQTQYKDLLKEGQNNIYSVVNNHVPLNIIKSKNKGRTWHYGYNDKYDMVVISKNGQIGQIVNISGLLIALPAVPDDVYKRNHIKSE